MPWIPEQRLHHQIPIAVPLATVLPPPTDFAKPLIPPTSDLPSQTVQVMMSIGVANCGSLPVLTIALVTTGSWRGKSADYLDAVLYFL